ncbi:hypothetical protein SAMN02745729_12241 [Marinobacterium iners DSM 11526]|uniref:Uncharacterized protein n=1 Tax=Marinobacterium iners DSM 11526 TaxID=1122198 RepID=A0A1H4GYA4_9GAMM|nr:hypothetical protein SAMN02745729_12241 [Marinobacterium iners DSM 11526]
MNFYHSTHQYYCGIDLHARMPLSMYPRSIKRDLPRLKQLVRFFCSLNTTY